MNDLDDTREQRSHDRNSTKMIIRMTTCRFSTRWKVMSFSVTFLVVVFFIGGPGPLGGSGGGVEARRRFTYLNKWYKVACIAENLKETDHYICDEHGYIRCLPGWTNVHGLCSTPICQHDCEHGNCSGPDTCTCEVGWTSANCSQCICLPGCDNGYCDLPFECRCRPGWTGMLCNKPMCKPGCAHGHCSSPGECVCHPGWTGENCTECIPLPGCHWRNGYCSKPMECKCHDGYVGNFCKHANCTTGCHPQYGYCINPNTCWCHTGWTGPTCNECMRYPGCVNGRCNLPWECICDAGWHGKKCDQPGEGPTTPAYGHTYPPGHGFHGHSIDHPNNHGFSTHIGVGKRDTDERAKIAIQEVTRMLEPNSLSTLEREDDDDIDDMPRRSVSLPEVTERVVPVSNFNEDTLLSTVDNGDVLTTIS